MRTPTGDPDWVTKRGFGNVSVIVQEVVEAQGDAYEAAIVTMVGAPELVVFR